MPEDFTEFAMLEDADLSFQGEQLKQPFVPAGGKQKTKNRNNKQVSVPADNSKIVRMAADESPTTIDTVKQSSAPELPKSTGEPEAAQQNTLDPVSALSMLMDVVPDMFDNSVKVYDAVRSILPVRPILGMTIVACIPLLACYLTSRRQE